MKDNQLTLIFDLDDTLIENAKYFMDVKKKVAGQILLLDPHAEPLASLIEAFDRKEQKNLEEGYSRGIENFRVSLMQQSALCLGYKFYHSRLYRYIDNRITSLGKKPAKMKKGVSETIVTLKNRGYRLIILTNGPEHEQLKKISSLPIRAFFDGVEISEEKNCDAYRSCLARFHLRQEYCFMIGDSFSSDILPAKEVGLRTVYIPSREKRTLSFGKVLKKPPPTIELGEFSELPSVLPV